ncbi:MAG: GerMN domain-containing protein [Acidimicrobiales bacterium]
MRFVIITALLAGSGCGVRSDPGPRALSSDEVPFALLEESASTTIAVPSTAPSVAKAPVFVFFVLAGRMYPVMRQVNAPATVPKSLTALVFGTQSDEAIQGIRSAINPEAGVQSRAIDPATFLVDLSAEFVQGSTSEQVLGLAQIVYTATEIPGVTGVLFTLNGEPIEVPTASGSLTSRPINREAFADFAPVAPGATTPA